MRHRSAQGRALHELQLGIPLPSVFTFRAELSSLAHLHPKKSLQTSFTPSRNAYISQIAPSPDGALLAIASTDGRVEIHEPADDATLRLTLLPSQSSKLSSCAWRTQSDSDGVFLTLYRDVCFYDLNTCRVDRPSRKFSVPHGIISEIAAVNEHSFAVSATNSLLLFDARLRSRSACVAKIHTKLHDAVITAHDLCVYGAESGCILLWDRRKLAVSNKSPTAMEKKQTAEVANRTVARGGRFDMLRVLPESAQGVVAYQMGDGSVGYADVVGEGGEAIPERRPEVRVGNSKGPELDDFGTYATGLNYPWYVNRRRGAIFAAGFRRGWRMVVPTVHKSGYRVVGFGGGMEISSYEKGWNRHCSCIQPLDNSLERLVVGGVLNDVHMLEVDFQETERRKKEKPS